MTEPLFFIVIGSLLTAGVAPLVAAALTLWKARRGVEPAEHRTEHLLRKEHARLLALLREECSIFKEKLKQERERHMETQRRAERLCREHLLPQQQQNRLAEELKREREQRLKAQQEAERLDREYLLLSQEQGQLAEELERERVKHLQAQQQAQQEREGRARERQDAERRITHLKRELQELREVQRDRGARRGSSPTVPAGLPEDLLKPRELSGESSLPTQRAQGDGRTPRPAGFPETTASKPGVGPPKDKKSSPPGVWQPHPDAYRGKAPAGQERGAPSDAPIKMFRKHYDKYLENYRGYVELAEGLYRVRGNGAVLPGSPGEREWEDSLRRVNDGIERTTTRLDILEEHNPELATDDDRISHRASLARRYLKLERKQAGS